MYLKALLLGLLLCLTVSYAGAAQGTVTLNAQSLRWQVLHGELAYLVHSSTAVTGELIYGVSDGSVGFGAGIRHYFAFDGWYVGAKVLFDSFHQTEDDPRFALFPTVETGYTWVWSGGMTLDFGMNFGHSRNDLGYNFGVGGPVSLKLGVGYSF